MKIRKLFSVDLNVSDPIQFATDPDKNALLRVREEYGGVCFQDVRICEVIAIKKRSKIRSNSVGNISAGTVSVMFEAICSIISPGSAYPAVKILKEQQVIMGEGVGEVAEDEPIAVTLVGANESLPSGSIIPIKIWSAQGSIKYTPSHKMPTAMAELLTCRTEAAVWRVSDVSPESVHEATIDTIWDSIEEALKTKKHLEASSDTSSMRAFFSKLLHTYITPPEGSAGQATLFDNRAALEAWAEGLKVGDVVTRSLEAAYDLHGVMTNPPDEPGSGRHIPSASTGAILAKFATEVLQSVVLLNQMAEHYCKDIGVMKRQLNVWRIMRDAQRAD